MFCLPSLVFVFLLNASAGCRHGVDAGLYMERGSGERLEATRGTVFSVRTAQRVYHLKADCEADMVKWVDAICRVCGLRAEQPSSTPYILANHTGAGEPTTSAPDANPYIPISECITGPACIGEGGRPRAHTYSHNARRAPAPLDNSDNDSTRSAEDPRVPARNSGPPVPPRPESKYTLVKDGTTHSGSVYIARNSVKWSSGRGHEDMNHNRARTYTNTWAPPVPIYDNTRNRANSYLPPVNNYCNMMTVYSVPPVVDRNLKPVHTYCNISQLPQCRRPETIQYITLDLGPPSSDKIISRASRNGELEEESPYKTVDFHKTEAFNQTRQDAEALRRNQMIHL